MTGLTPAQITELGKYKQQQERNSIQGDAQNLAREVAINRAKYKQGESDLANRQLVLDNAIQKMNQLKTNATLKKDAITIQKIQAEIDKMTREAAGIKALSTWQADNLGQWPSAALLTAAGQKPTQEKVTEDRGLMTEQGMTSYITGRFKDTGFFAQMESGKIPDKTINATVGIANKLVANGVGRVQAAQESVKEMFKRIRQYHWIMAGKDSRYTTPEQITHVKNIFNATYGFIPKAEVTDE